MRNRLFARSALALALQLGLVVASPATTLVPVTVEEMATQAEWIVEGRVTETRSAWNADQTQIHTLVTVAVHGVLKGAYPESTLQLRLLGGVADGIAMTIVDGPVMRDGDQVVLFVRPDAGGPFPIVGLSQGLFKYAPDPRTGLEVAINPQGVSLPRSALQQRIDRALGK